MIYNFFFSSRRRHTRWNCDWSSDVCSSDLVTVTLPKPQLEPAVLNVDQSYVYAEQQGLFNRVGNFFSGNPNSQQQVYQIAQGKIETAAKQSPLLADAQKNTAGMLTGMLTSLGFQHVTVTFGSASTSAGAGS